MARSKTSARWLKEHFDDQYVKQSKQDGYRSRASYKLLEIQKKDQLFKPGMTVILLKVQRHYVRPRYVELYLRGSIGRDYLVR